MSERTIAACQDPRDMPDLGLKVPEDYAGMHAAQWLDADGLRGARIGVARNFCGVDPHVDAALEESLQVMRKLGATVIDGANIATKEQLGAPEMEVLHYEFKAGLNAYLGKLGPGARVHSLADVIAYNNAKSETIMPYFGQEHFLAAQEKGTLADDVYQRALAECRRLAREEGIDATMSAFNLDAIVAPTGGPAWLTDWVNGDSYKGGSSSPAAVAGYPTISVPAGYVFGLPVNISFIGGAWQEGTLIRLAYAFEQATQARRPPQFLPTLTFS